MELRKSKLSRMGKKISIAVLVLFLIGGVIAYLEYNKPHEDYGSQDASLQISSIDLFSAFSGNEENANTLYLDKVIKVNGSITEITMDENNSMVVLQSSDDFFGVNVYFEKGEDISVFETGDQLIVKGRCTGGNSMGVVINNGIILEK